MMLYGQDMEVMKRVVLRKYYLFKYVCLGLLRICYLRSVAGLSGVLFYSTWLLSPLGWRRESSSNSVLLRLLGFGLGLFLVYNFKEYCVFVYSFFDHPVMSEKGYIGALVFSACGIVWLVQLIACLCSSWYRGLVGAYWERVCMLNVVVLVVLLSLFAQVGRIKFGIRVWYPNERVYDTSRIGLDFWGS